MVSGLSADSGSALRARYLAKYLRKAGAQARDVSGIRALPLWADWPLSMLWNLRLVFAPCDIIVGCKPLPTIVPLLLLKKLSGALIVVDIDDLDFAYRTGLASRALRAMQTPFPRRFDLVTYHNESLAPVIRDLFKVSPARMVRLRQAVDLDVFSTERVGPKAQLNPSARWVIYPAHLNVASDLECVFETMRIVRHSVPSARLLVVGGGPAKRRLRGLARLRGMKDAAAFTGHVPPEDAAKFMKASDVGLVYYRDLPVNHYRESMKVREMLAMGMKIVATNVGDLRQFAAFTYQADPVPQAVAQVLIHVLRTNGDGRETAGAAFVRREMDWEQVGRSFYDVLIAALAERRRSR